MTASSPAANTGWRLYQCADCEDQAAPHEEVRYDGLLFLCVRCGAFHSFVDAGPVTIARASR